MSKRPSPVIVDLTDEQQQQMGHLLAYAGDLAEAGTPGMVLAQVFRGQMRVGVMPPDKAVALQEALGITSRPVSNGVNAPRRYLKAV